MGAEGSRLVNAATGEIDPEVQELRAQALEHWRQTPAVQNGRVEPLLLPDLLSVLRWLAPTNLEEKKLWIRRFCYANESEDTKRGELEMQLIKRFMSSGHLPRDSDKHWKAIADVDIMVKDARFSAAPEAAALQERVARGMANEISRFRRSAVFKVNGVDLEEEEEQQQQQGTSKSSFSKPTPQPEAEIDYSESESAFLLRRLRQVPRKSAREGTDFRELLDRAAQPDMELLRVDLAKNSDFRSLLPQHKGQAVRALALAALEGNLEEVYLDGLDLDLACAEALAVLLRGPHLRVVSLAANKLNETAVQRIARAIFHHPTLQELSIGDQNGVALSTHAISQLLDGMATIPSLTKLRLGKIHDDLCRRRYVELETKHVEEARKLQRKHQLDSAYDGDCAGDALAGALEAANAADATEGASASAAVQAGEEGAEAAAVGPGAPTGVTPAPNAVATVTRSGGVAATVAAAASAPLAAIAAAAGAGGSGRRGGATAARLLTTTVQASDGGSSRGAASNPPPQQRQQQAQQGSSQAHSIAGGNSAAAAALGTTPGVDPASSATVTSGGGSVTSSGAAASSSSAASPTRPASPPTARWEGAAPRAPAAPKKDEPPSLWLLEAQRIASHS